MERERRERGDVRWREREGREGSRWLRLVAARERDSDQASASASARHVTA